MLADPSQRAIVLELQSTHNAMLQTVSNGIVAIRRYLDAAPDGIDYTAIKTLIDTRRGD